MTYERPTWNGYLDGLGLRFPVVPLRLNLRRDDFEFEQLFARTVSVNGNLRRQQHPCILHHDVIHTLEHIPLYDVKLLPGGRYVVASSYDTQRWSILIRLLEHPKANARQFPFVAVPTESRAYEIQAKYMPYRGHDVLMIMFLQRQRNWDVYVYIFLSSQRKSVYRLF